MSKLVNFMSAAPFLNILDPAQFKKPTNVNYEAHFKVKTHWDFTVEAALSYVLVTGRHIMCVQEEKVYVRLYK